MPSRTGSTPSRDRGPLDRRDDGSPRRNEHRNALRSNPRPYHSPYPPPASTSPAASTAADRSLHAGLALPATSHAAGQYRDVSRPMAVDGIVDGIPGLYITAPPTAPSTGRLPAPTEWENSVFDLFLLANSVQEARRPTMVTPPPWPSDASVRQYEPPYNDMDSCLWEEYEEFWDLPRGTVRLCRRWYYGFDVDPRAPFDIITVPDEGR